MVSKSQGLNLVQLHIKDADLKELFNFFHLQNWIPQRKYAVLQLHAAA